MIYKLNQFNELNAEGRINSMLHWAHSTLFGVKILHDLNLVDLIQMVVCVYKQNSYLYSKVFKTGLNILT